MGSLLHDAAKKVVGNEMHAQFAFDHLGGKATKHVHVEMDFDLAEVKFDVPAAEIEFGQVDRGYGGVEQGGHEGDAARTKATIGDGVANNAHRRWSRAEERIGKEACRRDIGQGASGDDHIEFGTLGSWAPMATRIFFFGKPHQGFHSASQQAGDGAEGTEPSVGHEESILPKTLQRSWKRRLSSSAAVAVSRFKQSSGEQAERPPA